ncbi:hypothetical protein [Streptomyces sp. SID3343]|uniref:hypothetical protein n=1 Tax=Streptomyces sp. SID3343 TaxID=2690260 RepID=UPI00136CE3C0|nr:hypothetical protein [Streptomyces sp. SID3343]MYV97106.1 hypothetical protein [Streptomyces sp. SID3343]
MRTSVVPVACVVAAVIALSGCSSDDKKSDNANKDGGSGTSAPPAGASPSASPPAAASTAPGATAPVSSAPAPAGKRDRAAVVHQGIDAVRKAESFRLVMDMQSEGTGMKNDIRVVAGKGNTMEITVGGAVTQALYSGGDVYRRIGSTGPWEKTDVAQDPKLKSGEWFKLTSMLADDVYTETAGSAALTDVEPITIDGVVCEGVRKEDNTYYFTPGESGYFRRMVTGGDDGVTMVWDITELNKPVDLTPPTDLAS